MKQEYLPKTPTSRGPPSKNQKTALTAEGGEMTHPVVPETTSTVAFFDLSITSLKSQDPSGCSGPILEIKDSAEASFQYRSEYVIIFSVRQNL